MVDAAREPSGLPLGVPFVGRSAELEFLKVEYDRVAGGAGGRLLLISGDAGVGKTRLVRELGAYVLGKQGLFLEGHYLREGEAPYGPWVAALRAALRDLTPPELAQMAGPFGADLVPVLPELAGLADPALPGLPAGPDDRRQRLYDAFAELIGGLARPCGLLLLLDDLQWAPGLTLLSHVARRLSSTRALIVGAYRGPELREQPALVRSWAELNRARLALHLTLLPFEEQETAELIGRYLGEAPAQELRGMLHRRAKGNAFFIEELLRSLVESGAVRARADGSGWQVAAAVDLTLPESLKLAVEERVDRLGTLAKEVLTEASVFGQSF